MAVLVDGLWIDAETGEVLELERKPDFLITDESSADWVLERIMNAEVEKARLEIKRKALVENLDRQIADQQRRIDGLHFRFDNDLQQFAKEQLEGKKTRTLKLTYGQLSFRTVKGGLRVKNAAKALDWARVYAPSTIKTTETFQISLMGGTHTEEALEHIEKEAQFGLASKAADAFELKPDEDKFTVKTGVGS